MEKQFIGKYEIVSTIGRGSMGVVYKARDPEIGRIVAIKTLRTLFLSDDEQGREALQRFRQESRSAGSLQHPNIITIYEAGKTSNGSPYIVMSFIDGKSLETMLKEECPIEPFAVMHYLAQVASALDYAHALNVIHRDVKPSNILINDQNRPFLVDFGVAKLSDSSLTPAGTVVGTPSYMPPEQIRGEKITGAADLFSLAVLAYECLCGTRPFAGNDFSTVVRNILQREPLRFEEINCKLPVELEAVFAKALAKEANERYLTATEFVMAMAKVLDIAVDPGGVLGGYRLSMKYVYHDATVGPEQLNVKPEDSESREENIQPVVDVATQSCMAAQYETAPGEVRRTTGSRRWVVLILILGVFVGGYFFSASSPEKETAQETSLQVEEFSSSQSIVATEVPPKQSNPVAAENPKIETATPEVDYAALTMAQLSSLPTEALITASQSANLPQANRVLIIQEFGKRDINAVLPAYKQLGKDKDYIIRLEVAKALKNLAFADNDKVFALLVDLLYDSDVYVRGFAAKTLGFYNTDKAKAALRERLSQEEQQVVKSVINKALGDKGQESAVPSSSASSTITQ
ncbi:MAG: protein kinase [Deltaproteobacteria bacterium]|nr:protein kinase [Deltaproteobacteria bacterium]